MELGGGEMKTELVFTFLRDFLIQWGPTSNWVWVLVGCFFSSKILPLPPEPEVLTSQKNWIVSVEFSKTSLEQEINVSRCETKNNERKKWDHRTNVEYWRRTNRVSYISIKGPVGLNSLCSLSPTTCLFPAVEQARERVKGGPASEDFDG